MNGAHYSTSHAGNHWRTAPTLRSVAKIEARALKAAVGARARLGIWQTALLVAIVAAAFVLNGTGGR